MFLFVSGLILSEVCWFYCTIYVNIRASQSVQYTMLHIVLHKKKSNSHYSSPPPSSIIRTSYFYHTICHIRAKDTHKFIILSNSHMNYIYYTYACRFWFWVMMFDDDNNALRFRRNAEEKMIQILYHFISISPFYYIQK